MNRLSWEDCIHQKIVVEQGKDLERSQSLLNISKLRFAFWKNTQAPDFLKVEGYYEVIKELLLSLIYQKGLNCLNHICLIAFLEEFYPNLNFEANKINQLRIFRNDVNYRGKFMDENYLKNNEVQINAIIVKLLSISESNIKEEN
ncbi:MAG: hypothetical protein PHU51_01365 [Candidatus Nanoarchaeia archaeon]|nr:hypothetical protein [Candidatus Nanoarchaeia archaeon]